MEATELLNTIKNLDLPASLKNNINAELAEAQSYNRLSDDVWEIINESTLDQSTIDWPTTFPEASALRLVLYKQLFRSFGNSEASGKLEVTNPKNKIDQIRWLNRALSSLEISADTRLHSLSKSSLLELFINTLNKEQIGRESQPIAHSTLEKRIYIVEKVCTLYNAGALIDGFAAMPSRAEIYDSVKPIVTAHYDWPEWRAEGSYGSIPLELAMLYLNEAIQIVRSDEQKWCAVMTTLAKEIKLPKDFWKRIIERSKSNWEPPKSRATGGEFTPEVARFIELAMAAFDCKREDLPAFPFNNGVDYSRFCKLFHSACLIIFFCLTGARISEINSIRSGWLLKDTANRYKFKSEIVKTNKSIKTVRHIAGLAAEAYDAMHALKLREVDNDNMFQQPTFKWARPYEEHIDTHGNYQTITTRLKEFADHIAEKYGEEFEYSPSPHKFRHTFAEFALRRFEGDVIEAIRQHYRHAWGSFMTGRYARRKIKEALAQADDAKLLNELLQSNSPIVQEYFREIIQRAANGEELYGQTGKWIMARVKDIEVLDPDTANEIIKEFDGTIEPHEYGICMVRKESKMQAKCFDKDTGTANTKEARFSLCGACANFCATASNIEAIYRIGQRANEQIAQYRKLGLIELATIEEQTVKAAEALVKQYNKETADV